MSTPPSLSSRGRRGEKGDLPVADRAGIAARWREDFDRENKRRALAAVAACAVHDFNNALAAIMGHITLARDTLPFDQDATVEDLEAALNACTNARKLVSYFIDYLENNRPSPRRVDLSWLIDEAIRSVQTILGTDPPLIAERLAANLQMIGDPDILFQAALSLFLGAAREASATQSTAWVSLHKARPDKILKRQAGRSRHGYCELVIECRGGSRSPSARGPKFGPLIAQIPDPETPGLPLAVVRRIVYDHGGAVLVGDNGDTSIFFPLA